MLGIRFENNYSYLPTVGTCGGILIVASEEHFNLLSSSQTRNTLLVMIHLLDNATKWTLMRVYGP
jgi:hypothetical protein